MMSVLALDGQRCCRRNYDWRGFGLRRRGGDEDTEGQPRCEPFLNSSLLLRNREAVLEQRLSTPGV